MLKLYNKLVKVMSNFKNQLHDLVRRNNRLKSRLRHAQLKNNLFKLNHSKKGLDLVLKDYKLDKSLIKACLSNRLNSHNVINAYVQGALGNPGFREFYLEVNKINNLQLEVKSKPVKDYTLKNYGSCWIYTTVINDEKISLISSDYERLVKTIKERKLSF